MQNNTEIKKTYYSPSRDTVRDILSAAKMYQLWGRLGWNDVLQRYQRSILGPFWLTLSMGVLIGALGFLYASLFKMDLSIYLPFLTVGFILWQLISGMILDGCAAFVSAEGIIKQVKLPISLHVYRLLWKNALTFFHNAIIIAIVMFFFDITLTWDFLLVFVGLFFILINGAWFSLLFGMLCARYRDLSPTIASLVQLSFFVTPIIWSPSLLPDRQFIMLYNPFYHFIESVRGPILGTSVGTDTWLILAGITLFGWGLVIPVVGRMQRRLVYWL